MWRPHSHSHPFLSTRGNHGELQPGFKHKTCDNTKSTAHAAALWRGAGSLPRPHDSSVCQGRTTLQFAKAARLFSVPRPHDSSVCQGRTTLQCAKAARLLSVPRPHDSLNTHMHKDCFAHANAKHNNSRCCSSAMRQPCQGLETYPRYWPRRKAASAVPCLLEPTRIK
jgi:hypothetical protein